uniref:non-specific serine/threonine protein kinase n=1 Tax=Oryza barthii TaxID=65489 RepID=A0A0D3FU00_9ORYZ
MSPGNLFADFTVLVVVVLAVAAPPVSGQRSVYPSANLSTLWVNNKVLDTVTYDDGSTVRAIVLRSPQTFSDPSFAAGFFCTPPCQEFIFAVFILTATHAQNPLPVTTMAQVVWCANRANPVGENATLELTGDGDLVLREKANGRLIWSSGTSGQSVRRMEITEQGNLVLFDQRNMTVWQSFDHPTDALVPGQSLLQGKMLRANASPTNWTEGNPDDIIPLPEAKSTQYIRLESDGHMKLYEWFTEGKWTMVLDVTKQLLLDDCAFPTVCGGYGICTGGQCSCLIQSNSSSRYFQPIDYRRQSLGCAPVTPISCQEMKNHQLLTLTDVSYFDMGQIIMNAKNRDDCKQACLKNCSCRAVAFRYGQNDSNGECQSVTEVFSLQSIQPEKVNYNSSAYLKINPSSDPTQKKLKTILGATLAATITLVMVVIIAIYTSAKKLGEGGFGSVFEGKIDEERVAVKRLEGASQGKKEFMAEVETIGSIEHINLVRLIGFCAEKSHRLLVYEYMPRGSLDRWIYYHHNNAPLDWCTRCRIILDIAKGLCYLHEECRRKIAHLDIKPQNILLGENFNAKLADFGLSKLIDRDQSNVMTVMRGTPGYLAPEWLTSPITEKVDIYSFGVVLMEIISGRKNIDISLPKESVQLINLLREKAQNNQLIDMIDKHGNDMVSHKEEVIQMMKLAIWCLQNDSSRRPSMSTVVKVLEGAMSVENCLDYGFFNASSITHPHVLLHLLRQYYLVQDERRARRRVVDHFGVRQPSAGNGEAVFSVTTSAHRRLCNSSTMRLANRPNPFCFGVMVAAVVAVVLAAAAPSVSGQRSDYPMANLSTRWVNNAAVLPHSVTYSDGSAVRAIVLRSPKALYGPSFAAGFFCTPPCQAFLFAVFIVYTNSGAGITSVVNGMAQVIWSANRASPVGENATLELTGEGDLVLREANGRLVWSSGTSGRSVAGMEITENGSLVLFDQRNGTVWQSFDHPTDALVPGQSLQQGMRLTANTSTTNWTESKLYMTVLPDGLYGYVESTPPQLYYKPQVRINKSGQNLTRVTFTNGSLSIFVPSTQPGNTDNSIALPSAKSTQYIRLESDGHLRLYEWSGTESKWTMVSDVIKIFPDDCTFPTVCGEYGICTSGGGQCICPVENNSSTSYFHPVDERKANLGCAPVTPISCQEMKNHKFLTLTDVSYFDESQIIVNAKNKDDCKQACLKNCSCRAVAFRYGQNDSDGQCQSVTEVFSLQSIQPETVHYNSSAYLKVQITPSASDPTQNKKKTILAATLAAITTLVLVVIVAIYVRRRRKYQELDEELDFDILPGMPTRFSFEKLRECTDDFSKKLGEGGFGSVFEGKIGEESVAVKRLEGARQGKKEFLAEVETIGSIEHINLVRLIGFCAEKSNRLLVYEYMPRGSLDRWIYYRHNNAPLDWCTRCKIIMDIAKGLCYLHEECRRKIAHLDIKPQNILLDENFNAKLADFGLSKLIDRDQSKVVTVMRGTPGYLAPEWLTSQITEKVDIYSFGVVLMEIVSGRKNIDISQPEESVQLINLLREKAQNDQLLDMIDKHSNDMVSHQEEVIQMMKLAMWCLQNDSSRRPSMLMVVKVLEGAMSVENCLDYSFFNANSVISAQGNPSTYSAPPQASILSGPR